MSHDFFSQLARIFNAHQARSVILCGNVYDLFYDGRDYVPLIPFLAEKSKTRGLIRIVYELNGPVRILDDREKLKNSWIAPVTVDLIFIMEFILLDLIQRCLLSLRNSSD